MKNLKQIALGLLVGAMAISFSAFTSKSTVKFSAHRVVKVGMISDDFIVQPTNGNFTEMASVDVSHCKLTSPRECVYDVTTSGQTNIPDQASYTSTQVDTYVSNGWLTPDASSSNALYRP